MTDDLTPSAPEEPAGGPLSAKQPAPDPRVEPPRADASGGRTAGRGIFHACPPDCPGCNAPGGVGECGPEDRPAAHSCRNCAGIDPDTCLANPDRPKPTPDTPDAARYARWLAVVRGDRGLDPVVAHEITAAAIAEADGEHTGIQLACAEQAARATAHLEGVSAEADGWQRRYEQAAAAVLAARALAERWRHTPDRKRAAAELDEALNQAGQPAPTPHPQEEPMTDHDAFRWHALSECPGEDDCPTHGRPEPAVPAAGLRGLLEHVGIDTTGRDITVDGKVVDAAPAGGSDQRRQQYADAELASLAVNAANALRDEKRHYRIAAEENARLRAETAQLRQKLADAEHRASTYRAAWHSARRDRRKLREQAAVEQNAEAALDRVHRACAATPPCIPGSQAEDVAHSQGWNAAMDHILAALVGPAVPSTNRRDKDADLRAALDRVRAAIAERRTEVAEYEAEQPPSSWSDAVTVTCDRIEDALRQPAPSPGVVLTDPQQ